MKKILNKVFLIMYAIKNGFIEGISFTLLMGLYILNLVFVKTAFIPHLPNGVRDWLLKTASRNGDLTIRISKAVSKQENMMTPFDIYDLAIRNMIVKKTRSIITVGGMSLGVAAIVFLVTVGYGLQNLVISRVSRLDELKQIDISAPTGSNLGLNDKSVSDFTSISKVKEVLPVVGLVAKVSYQGSISDVAVYGVLVSYLKSSAIKTVEGKLFTKNELTITDKATTVNEDSTVAGVSTQRTSFSFYSIMGPVYYSIYPRMWIELRKAPLFSSKVFAYTRKVEGIQNGDEYLGEEYYPYVNGRAVKSLENQWLGRWVRSKVYLWEKKKCSREATNCEDGQYVKITDNYGKQAFDIGYFPEIDMMVKGNVIANYSSPSVLGISINVLAATAPALTGTSSQEVVQSSASAEMVKDYPTLSPADLAFLELVSESSESSRSAVATKTVKLPDSITKEAVVNKSFLDILGIPATGAVGKEFGTSYVVTSDLLSDNSTNLQSEEIKYKIVGVVPGDNVPFFYVPISDVKVLGIEKYSQIRVVSDTKESLSNIREKIEAMGFITNSVADTIARINSLFGTVRIVLGLIGAVALSVAALGMFNTLTVSLLERTREIGLMKAMGMTSHEVKRLFLTESMIMGMFGGIIGIIFGFLAGKMLSLILSIVGLARGAGFIDIVYLPISFALLVLGLSLAVGILTGIYPSRRATKISALDALRYE
jgi:ABC-type antimicrobial peptide transport system permease subunit